VVQGLDFFLALDIYGVSWDEIKGLLQVNVGYKAKYCDIATHGRVSIIESEKNRLIELETTFSDEPMNNARYSITVDSVFDSG
jgi:hypothetical protein